MQPGTMGDHSSCKYWSYTSHPDRQAGLGKRCRYLTDAALLSEPVVGRADFDTRAAHGFMFQGMTPASCTCIIGNYRGTPGCPDLVTCPVKVADDDKVGLAPELVHGAMRKLDEECNEIMNGYYRWVDGEGQTATLDRQLRKFAIEAAKVFERFLTIHPYVDGNGHCARLLVFRMLVWARFPPRQWDIDATLDLHQELKAYRREQRGPLIQKLTLFVLQSM
ncbi:Fic family protein [Polaromonas sp. YR568]|uniref:Fic family protein n=1 Tax=Polaromonas sp. YR568 TaxID=1855301 RepID=UPI00398BF664